MSDIMFYSSVFILAKHWNIFVSLYLEAGDYILYVVSYRM